MADTTADRVKAIASHLKGLNDSDIQMYIDDAKEELDRYSIKDEHKERLQRYLAAHLASLNQRRADSHSISGRISVSYSPSDKGSGLDSTEYGQEYKRLLRRATGLRLIVL
ncbi:DUF4054 domain-containing protein [Salibacterium halotolerans]|uniref:DUF4054 domain-containing protein n=1 Tax=Salibacterium halotolerans TaxID=1884432 RepID=A0A1I5NBJ6_9BACI|nr:DUF4054 domain-containing protein [Salibacterium halotolerans]SFP18591.1 Protein of unknown function [Salibacterium halotolerans]